MEHLRLAARCHWLNALVAWEWFAPVPSGTKTPMRVRPLNNADICCMILPLLENSYLLIWSFSVHGSILSLASNASSSYSSVSVSGMQSQVATAQYMAWCDVCLCDCVCAVDCTHASLLFDNKVSTQDLLPWWTPYFIILLSFCLI